MLGVNGQLGEEFDVPKCWSTSELCSQSPQHISRFQIWFTMENADDPVLVAEVWRNLQKRLTYGEVV